MTSRCPSFAGFDALVMEMPASKVATVCVSKKPGFRPAPWLPGRHLQTIVPSLWPAPEVPGRTDQMIVPVAPASSVLLQINRPRERVRGTLVLIHGMCGSSESSYMRRTASTALGRGWTAVRMNLRNCGGTEALSNTLYNAGQSDDVARVLEALRSARYPRPFAAAGFSLGGNILLRYVGLEGAASLAAAAVAVNPPIDLERSARAIEQSRNRLYQYYYTLRLRKQLVRIRQVRPVARPIPSVRSLGSVRRFDAMFTAPDAGFESAEAYYAGSSAVVHLSKVVTPSLIISAANDPFIDKEMFDSAGDWPSVGCLFPGEGGHCGYWQSASPRFWAADAILDFVDRVVTGS